MIVVLKGFLWEFDIGISKYSHFESRQFQSISVKFSDWDSLRLPQSEASDWYQTYQTTLCSLLHVSHLPLCIIDLGYLLFRFNI